MPKLLPLVINPNGILRKIAEPVKLEAILELKELAEDMAETMIKEDGVGLAAPQIGKSIRLITINTKDQGPVAMFNPEISKLSLLKEWGEEGCLSLPKIFGDVKRHKKLRCTFIDTEAKTRTIEASGFMARIIQHEVDHLNGILFTDKAKNIHTVE